MVPRHVLAKALFLTFAFLGGTHGATLTGSLTLGYGFAPLSGSITITDGTRSLTSSGPPLGLGSGGCLPPGANTSGTCSYNPSFQLELGPGFMWVYQSTPGVFETVTASVFITAVGTPFELQVTNGFSSHQNVPLTITGSITAISAQMNPGACVWCETFTGTGVSSGERLGFDRDRRLVNLNLTSSPVPEPSTWVSFGLAGSFLAWMRYRRRL